MARKTSVTPASTPDAEPTSPSPVSRRVLIVEDNALARKQLTQLLQNDKRLQVTSTSDGQEALRDLLGKNYYSIVITDLRMPHVDGMQLIKEVRQRELPVTVIVTTGHGTINEAVKAMQLGAFDFLTKPIDVDNLRRVIDRALRERALQDELAQLREQLQRQFSFHNILSKNSQMHGVFELISNVGQTVSTVLIEGETGTGKEQVARAIHEASHRRTGPLVAVNCAALPETLLESELFGHEKGSFTSAAGQRKGRFELAHGGTIFLDEVGDVPAAMQAKLLRVLQERRFERVGGTESVEVDVRVIAATNRSLRRMVKQGIFREDLYYRLNVVKVDLPPLRERLEDIPLLATHFIQKYTRPGETPKQLAPEAMELLLNYRWPGNVRELENAIERACVTTSESVIQPGNLPPDVVNPPTPKTPFNVNLDQPLPELLRQVVASVEQQYLRKALKKAHGNVGRCAKLCGLSRRSVTAKLAEYGLDRMAFKEE